MRNMKKVLLVLVVCFFVLMSGECVFAEKEVIVEDGVAKVWDNVRTPDFTLSIPEGLAASTAAEMIRNSQTEPQLMDEYEKTLSVDFVKVWAPSSIRVTGKNFAIYHQKTKNISLFNLETYEFNHVSSVVFISFVFVLFYIITRIKHAVIQRSIRGFDNIPDYSTKWKETLFLSVKLSFPVIIGYLSGLCYSIVQDYFEVNFSIGLSISGVSFLFVLIMLFLFVTNYVSNNLEMSSGEEGKFFASCMFCFICSTPIAWESNFVAFYATLASVGLIIYSIVATTVDKRNEKFEKEATEDSFE